MLDYISRDTYKDTMRKLDSKTRALIIHLLIQGNSIGATSRIADVSKNTARKLLIDAGKACSKYHNENVRNVNASIVQCREIWSFTDAKQKDIATAKDAPEFAGDTWTWTAIDSESKLIISYMVGGRDSEYKMAFMDDLRDRLTNQAQLTTDGQNVYLEAVDGAFGADVKNSPLLKRYGGSTGNKALQKKNFPAECTGIRKYGIAGDQDKALILTSHVERQTRTMRMCTRRYTGLSNAFSKKVENHAYAIALHLMYYNYIRVHQTLKVTPAIKAGLTDHLWDICDLLAIVDANEPELKKRDHYKLRKKNNPKWPTSRNTQHTTIHHEKRTLDCYTTK